MKPKVVRHLAECCRLIQQPVMHQNRNLAMTVMKSSFVGLFFLYLSSTVSGLGSVVSRGYLYINIYYTWQEARSYCRIWNGDSDLATVYWQSDIEQQDMSIYNAWIGLHRETDVNQTLDGWTWPNGENLSFNAWAYGEPDWGQRCGYVNCNSKRLRSGDCEDCFFFICDNSEFIPESKMWDEAQLGKFHRYWRLKFTCQEGRLPSLDWTVQRCKQMAAQNCSHRFPFLCYWNNLVIIKENKTWEEALDHCRALRSPAHQQFCYDLVSVQPEDYNKIMAVVTEAITEEVWTGLRFLAGKWLWVNGADMKFSNLAQCPPTVQHCGVLRKTSTGSIETRDCAERRNFVCYRK